MENSQPKRNFVPLLVFLIIIGVLIASVSKPMQKSTPNDTPTNPLTISADDSTTFETICETTWPVAAGESGVPNLPDFGKGEHVCGNPNAKVIVVEYTDYECPFCKVFHPTLQKLVYESKGQIGWVLRHYPIDSLHSRARNEAAAAECAGEQQGEIAFWRFTDKVFEVTSSNNSLSPSLLPLIAVDLGLDKDAFNICLASGKYLPKIAAQEKLAEADGHEAIGTPNARIFVNGKFAEEIKGAVDFDTIKAKTDLWLKSE